jgi:hypothetical protein
VLLEQIVAKQESQIEALKDRAAPKQSKVIGVVVPNDIHERLLRLQGTGPKSKRKPLKALALEAIRAGLPLIASRH